MSVMNKKIFVFHFDEAEYVAVMFSYSKKLYV